MTPPEPCAINVALRERAVRAGVSSCRFVCECSDPHCGETIDVPLDEYEELLRSESSLLAQGHVMARAAHTRSRSAALREEAAALRAEATQLQRRTREYVQALAHEFERLGRVDREEILRAVSVRSTDCWRRFDEAVFELCTLHGVDYESIVERIRAAGS